jgi:hypothetical protein
MKRIGIIGATALFLMVGYTASAYAWQEPKQESKPAKEESKPAAKPQEAKPAKQEPQAKPAQHEEKATAAKRQEPAKQEEKPAAKPAGQEQQAKPAQQEEKAAKAKRQEPAKSEKRETAAKQAKPEEGGKAAAGQHAQRTPAEEQRQRAVPAVRLSVRTNVRIPDDRFRANFGQGHVFVISQPELVGGFSRFQYGGFSFGFLQPWPVGWYYTDDVYVDYVDGEYFLFNPYYPGARVGISVVI